MGKCIVCRERPAAVPDRNQMGRPIKRICRQCHADRLVGDLKEAVKKDPNKNVWGEYWWDTDY